MTGLVCHGQSHQNRVVIKALIFFPRKRNGHMSKSIQPASLAWPPLVEGILIRRYKRFMADVELKDQGIVTAHCPNSGSMKKCCEPGRPVFLSYHDNPNRKLKYTWELIRMPTSLVGVNTLVPNRLVFKAIQSKKIDKLSGFNEIKRVSPQSDQVTA